MLFVRHQLMCRALLHVCRSFVGRVILLRNRVKVAAASVRLDVAAIRASDGGRLCLNRVGCFPGVTAFEEFLPGVRVSKTIAHWNSSVKFTLMA